MGTTEDYIRWESIDRFRVNTTASKALLTTENKWHLKRRHINYWVISFAIGLMTGFIEFLNFEGLAFIQSSRIKLAKLILEKSGSGAAGIIGAWLVYSLSAVLVVGGACALIIKVAPMAKGGGIPEVKAFLNGVKVPGLLGLKVLLIKSLTTVCSVGGGLCCGQEGPMVHIGSCLGYNLSQMKYKKFPKLSRVFKKFQNDQDRRDFVTTGASAGVAAAFRAPIGGTLFGIEEAASFWSHELIWRTFFACMIATLAANMFIEPVHSEEGFWHFLSHPSHTLYYVPAPNSYKFWEIIPFIGTGCIGGLLGALFIKIVITVNKFRKATYYKKNVNKVVELSLIALITATLSILLPLLFSCRSAKDIGALAERSEMEAATSEAEPQVFERFLCPEGYYNPMASLWFTNSEISIKHMFIRMAPEALEIPELMTFFVGYYMLAACTVGM